MQWLIFISFVIECMFLALLEKRFWKTLYTPLNILMLPNVVIVILSVVLVNILGLYPFCYESLYIWMLGLLLFAIPSWCFSLYCSNRKLDTKLVIRLAQLPSPRILFSLFLFLLLVYGLHLRTALGSSASGIGSDEFAEQSSGGGLWGHYFVLVIAIEVISFFYLSRKKWYFIIPILLCLLYCVINQVKGWVIIPLFAGIFLKIVLGKLQITSRLLIGVLLGGAGFFFLSYYLSLVISADKEFTDDVLYFIFRNFFHYLSSGTLGLSMDIDHGIMERPSLEYLFTPFMNIVNLLKGQKMASNLNSYYLQTTWPGLATNIRGFMGTIFVYGRWFAPLVVILYSALSYLFRIKVLQKRTLVWLLLDVWMCSLLFMGWFDYYFALLKPFEVMLLFTLFSMVSTFFHINNPAIDATE